MPSAILPLALAFLMFAVGLKLSPGDFRPVFGQPRALLTGLSVQMLFLPVMAVMIAAGFSLSVPVATGLVILSLSPGGITSNFVAMLARADVALSAAMTMVTSIAVIFTVPAGLLLAGALVPVTHPTEVGLGRMAFAMTLVSVLPLLVGIGFARFAPSLTRRASPILAPLSKAVFAGIVVTTFVENWDVMSAHSASAGFACVVLNAGALAAAFLASRVMKLPQAQASAIAVEAGMQNAAVSMFIASSLFGDPALAIPALIYALVMNISALGLVAWRSMAPPEFAGSA